MKSPPGHGPTAGLAALLLAACGNAGVPHDITVRDSAGITIVENAPGALESAARWSVADSPSLRIGVVEGDSVYQFTRVAHAARLPGGGVAVLDGGPRVVRVYGPDGGFAASQGGRGDGPGEYQSPAGMYVLPGDSLVVHDSRQSRITVLAPPRPDSAPLAVARVVTPEAALASTRPAGVLDDGRLVVQSNHRVAEAMNQTPQQYLDVWTLALDDPSAADSLARFPRTRDGWLQMPAGPILLTGPIFAPVTRVAAGGDSVIVGSAHDYELVVMGGDGATRRIVRWEGPPLEVTAADRETHAAVVRRRAGDDPDRIRMNTEMVEVRGFNDTYAAYEHMLLARSGHVWLRDGQRAHQDWDTPRPWTVLDPQGRVAARVDLPEQFTPLEVGEDWVLGRWTDELGVQYVALFGVGEREGQGTSTGGGS